MEVAVPQQKPKRKWRKRALWSFGILIILLLSVLIAANVFLSRSLPETKGEISLPGLFETGYGSEGFKWGPAYQRSE
ncbi:hypothetical protein RCO48_14940 [Peribacillus frigoritolerans]|nr:hypothetical protein [Peribacillus frigoritolerans]